jgi:hypothetical protein
VHNDPAGHVKFRFFCAPPVLGLPFHHKRRELL